jgi:hypothetical protein
MHHNDNFYVSSFMSASYHTQGTLLPPCASFPPPSVDYPIGGNEPKWDH